MLTVASLLWTPNEYSKGFSEKYDETWAVKLYKGFERNLTIPWRFVLFVDRKRELPDGIQQETIRRRPIDYSCCIEPFRFGVPMLLCGLDTVVVGNIDHLGEYCLEGNRLALPRDPYYPDRSCNGVCLIPEGHQCIYRNWHGENDMDWLEGQPHDFIDDLFPGQVVSYKMSVRRKGLGDARIVYFHGDQKPDQLKNEVWIKKHWIAT